MRPRNILILIIVCCNLIIFCASMSYDTQLRGQTINNASIHSGPGMDHKVIDTISEGTHLILLDSKNDWYKVEIPNGKSGWVFKSWIRPVKFEEVVIITDKARIRKGPGNDYKAFAVLEKVRNLK